jgi:pimeloyl-ACP methyl ester carboxylesterase
MEENSMATFVICHGAWDGGWYWKEPSALLRKFGHEVYTPTLTGLGEREHLATSETNLDTHIQDIVNVCVYEGLQDVILVGHSYGGTVVTGVAERIPERISDLVYVDAYELNDGQSIADLFGNSPVVEQIIGLANQFGDGWRVPFPSEESYDPRHIAHPLQTMLQKLEVKNPKASSLPRTYIACTERGENPVYAPIVLCAKQAKSYDWRYYELATGHNPNETMPLELSNLLNDLVQQ